MIGASFDGSKTKVKGMTIRLNEFALGAGYGYNFVPSSHWLFHLSALPTITVYSHDYTKMKAEVEELEMVETSALKLYEDGLGADHLKI